MKPFVAERIIPAPAGAHPVSGSWLGLRYIPLPKECVSGGVEQANGHFTVIDFRRSRYVANVEGAAALVKTDGKDIVKATVSAPDDRTRIEVVSLNGKPLVQRAFALSADGRSMVTTVLNRLKGWSSAQRRSQNKP